MCGIAGFIGFDNNAGLAEMANQVQRHRGPDNQSVWVDDYVAFAHQRLSIIDLSESANQPMVKRNFVIVFNGEVYNYQELSARLIAEFGTSFNTHSDTEVVLEMFANYGVECFDQLVGMFAFSIYDTKSQQLIIARDHFGIKPLFYTNIGKSFAFSSELKTLVAVPGFNKTLNLKSIVSSFNYLWISGNETMFDDCFKLPAAHYLKYSTATGLEIRKYWSLDDSKKSSIGPQKMHVSDLDKTITSSVKRHMVADVPVSSFLSGGLDSSLVSVLAQKTNPGLSTYTISINEEDKAVEKMPDDLRYSKVVAEKFGFQHNVININPDIISELPRIVRSLDEPIGDPAAINTYLICAAARKNGVKILLSGMGADEIYFGYRRQQALLMARNFRRIPGSLRSIVSGAATKMPVRLFGKGFKVGRWAKRFVAFANLPTEEAYMRSYSYYDNSELTKLFKNDYSSAIESIREEHKAIFNSKYKGNLVNQVCNTDLNMFMLGLNLTYTDRASMAASIEVRVPFIDKLVVEQAMQIPAELKYKKRLSKFILKKVAEKYLPHEVIYRPKAAFGAPIRSWISKDLRPMVDDLLSEANIEKRGILNYSYVKSMVEADRAGTHDFAYQIYQFLTFELWCREFLDKDHIK